MTPSPANQGMFVKPHESTNDILQQELVGFRDLIIVLLQGHRRELSHHLVHADGPVAYPQQLSLHVVEQFEPTAVRIVVHRPIQHLNERLPVLRIAGD